MKLYVLVRRDNDVGNEQIAGVYNSIEGAKIDAERDCYEIVHDWRYYSTGRCWTLEGRRKAESPDDEHIIDVDYTWWITECDLNVFKHEINE